MNEYDQTNPAGLQPRQDAAPKRYCKDCVFFERGALSRFFFGDNFSNGKCLHSRNTTRNLVSGRSKQEYSAEALRIVPKEMNLGRVCGEEGRWFMPIEVEAE